MFLCRITFCECFFIILSRYIYIYTHMHACMPCMEHADGARSSLVCRKTLLSRRASCCREGSIVHQNKLLFCTVLESESTEKAHITELTSGRSTMHACIYCTIMHPIVSCPSTIAACSLQLQPLWASGMASVAFLRENLCSMPACPACFAVCLQHGHTPSHACQFSSETKSDCFTSLSETKSDFLFPLQCDLAVKEAWRLSSFYRRASGPVTGSLQKALSGSRQADPRKRRSSRLL